MDHSFTPSQIDALKCVKCKRGPFDHTDFAQCEACPNKGKCEIWADMLLCAECIKKEKQAALDHQSPEKQEARLQEMKANQPVSGILDISNLVDKARTLDHAIQVRQDFYNAEVISHVDVFKAIDTDTSIPADKKQFAKTKFLDDRYEEYRKALFEYQEKITEFNSRQRVVHEAFNKLASQLREEERNKLRLASPDYKPGAVKTPKETKPRSTAGKAAKFDRKEIIAQAAQLQKEGFVIEWAHLQMICTARQMTPAQAAEVVRKTMGGTV